MAKKKSGQEVASKTIKKGDSIRIGDVGSGVAIAAGRNASANISIGVSERQLNQTFISLLQALQDAPQESQAEAVEQAQQLQAELSKGEEANDSTIAKLVESIVDLVPGAVSAVVSIFASPILAGMVGPVTKFVLDKLVNKS